MLKRKLNTLLSIILICILFNAVTLEKAFAVKDYVRHNAFKSDGTLPGQCIIKKLEYNPFGGADFNLEFDNPVCIAWAVGHALVISGINKTLMQSCIPGLQFVNAWYNLPGMLVQGSANVIAASVAAIGYAATGNPLAGTCGVAAGAMAAAIGSIFATLAIIWDTANNAFENTRVCGHDWTIFAPLGMGGRINEEFTGTIPPIKTGILKIKDAERTDEANYRYVKRGAFPGSYKDFVLSKIKKASSSQLNVEDEEYGQYYRELIYNGKEYEDDYCEDPRPKNIKGYETKYQRYYMRGYEAPNFACERFIYMKQGNEAAYKEAYDCCVERSQNVICLERIDKKDKYKFCKLGEICHISPVSYKVFESTVDQRNICAKTYSLCPYNHNVGGGTEQEGTTWRKTDCIYNGKPTSCYGQPSNFCQLNLHCTQRPLEPFIYETGLGSKYFDDSCSNFKGDSQNDLSSNEIFDFVDGKPVLKKWYEIPVKVEYKGFTAPIAQCIKESIENTFYNRAGHSRCANDETPSPEGLCGGFQPKGCDVPNSSDCEEVLCPNNRKPIGGMCYNDRPEDYIYKKGCDLYTGECLDGSSFLRRSSADSKECDAWGVTCSNDGYIRVKSIFSQIQDYMSLIAKIIITLALMFYGYRILVTGEGINKKEILIFLLKIGFIAYFVTGNAWQEMFVNGITKIPAELTSIVLHQEGLLFFQSNQETLPNGRIDYPQFDGCYFSPSEYPSGKDYVAFWDMLDCKIARYIGYGPSLSVANIASMILIMAFSPGVGALLAVGLFIFAFFIIAIAIRALHIFLMSIIAIIIMIYVSPIIIPMILFKQTKGVFDNWLNNLIGFILQPMMLFAFLLISLHLFDLVMLGSATFSGVYRTGRVLNCNSEAEVDSILCILNFDETDVGQYPGAQAIGIAIPFLFEKDESARLGFRLSSLLGLKLITIVKSAFVMFILAKLIDQIPGLAANLAGGQTLGSKSPSFTQMQGRVMRTTGKVGHGIGARALGLGANIAVRLPVKGIKRAAATKKKNLS